MYLLQPENEPRGPLRPWRGFMIWTIGCGRRLLLVLLEWLLCDPEEAARLAWRPGGGWMSAGRCRIAPVQEYGHARGLPWETPALHG